MSTILLLEDDKTLNKNISLALGAEGYSVLTAETIAEAESQLASADLLLLDILLPDGNSRELCRKFREKSDKPVIFLTSCDDEADIVEGLDCGGDDYITKPFRLRELLSRIRANLRRSTSVEHRAPETTVELTAVEQKLLDYLMLNRDRYLTRDQILEQLWDCKGVFVNDNTLSVHISRLREKLKTSGRGQIITKRGLGYKWTDQTNS